MNSDCELPDPSSRLRQAYAERAGPSERRIDGFPRISTLRLIKGVESAIRRCVGGVSRWRRRRTAIRELQALSDHYLTDVGLERSQIVSTVEEMMATRDRRR